MSLKDRVTGDKTVTFVRYQNKDLWYVCEDGFEFPVPIDDAGSAEFKAQDRALFFMRWIRKHMDVISQALESQKASS